MKPIHFVLILPLLLQACVSFEIPKDEVKRATGINFTAPPVPFKSISVPHVDQSWQHPGTKETLSFLTNCGDTSDPTLVSIANEVVGSLEEPEFLSKKRFDYNSRGALFYSVKGYIEGVLTYLELVVLKKNKCIYILNHVSSQPPLTAEFQLNSDTTFSKFVREFRTP